MESKKDSKLTIATCLCPTSDPPSSQASSQSLCTFSNDPAYPYPLINDPIILSLSTPFRCFFPSPSSSTSVLIAPSTSLTPSKNSLRNPRNRSSAASDGACASGSSARSSATCRRV